MNKKKAIKIATASVMAASSFAAIAPFTTEAAVNVSASVTKATTQMKKAQDTYTSAAAKGQVASTATVQKQVDLAKKYYDDAKKVIAKSGGKNKAAYTKKLTAALPYYNNAKNYIAGVNYASALKDQGAKFEAAAQAGKVDAKAFATFSAELAKADKKVKDAVVGGTSERAVIAKYLAPAKKSAAAVNGYFQSVKAVSAINDIHAVQGDASVVLPKTVEVTLVNGKKAQKTVKWDTNYDLNKAGEYTVTGDVAGTDLTASVKVVVAAPQVTSVTAINGKDLEVVFNRAVDEVTAEAAANYEISINNASSLATTAYTVEVDKDNAKVVHITLSDASALDNGAYVSVKVKKAVLNAQLKPLVDDVTTTFTFVDNSAPTIQKVEKDGDDLKVTFNDYVSAVGLVKVNGVVKTPVVASSPYSKEVVVTDGAKDLANGTYTVQFANVQDIANVNGTGNTNVTSFANGSFTVADDTVAPVVSKIEKVDSDTFKLTFNKDVTAPTVTVKKNGLDLTPTVHSTADANVWTVDVADNGGVLLYATGETSATLAANISGFKAVSNNVVGDAVTQTVTLSKDQTAPALQTRFNEIVDDAAGGTNEVFHLHFDEPITVADASKIILTDKDGIRKSVDTVSVVADANGDNTILEIDSNAIQTAGVVGTGTYTLSLGKGTVQDLAGNDNAATTVSVAKTASSATDLSVTASATGNVITLPFGTEMTSSALDLANYKIDNKSLPAGTIAYFSGDKQTVKIELPASSIVNNEDAVLSVSTNVLSTSGAKLDTASRNQVVSGLVDNVVPTLVSAKKLTSTTIEATFSENLAAVANQASSQNDFVVKVNGVAFTVTGVTDGTVGDNKVVLTVTSYNLDQTVTVGMADSSIEIADLNAGNAVAAKTTVTATK